MVSHSVHQALMQTTTYPEGTSEVTFEQTHVSQLYFTDHYVYKLKKPVDFKFLNFTTLDRRRFYCEEEIRLNRRFAPDTYLGVIEIRENQGQVSIGGSGTIIEYAVWMRRLPAERMLDWLIAQQSFELPAQIDRLAPLLSHLENEAPVCRDNGARSNLDAVRGNWRENFEQMAPYIGQTLSFTGENHCRRFVDAFLQSHEQLFLQRERAGFVREGHGDLHAEHICLTDPIRIYDCIEFNRRFRVADVAADLAFLLMDLEYRQRRDLSDRLLQGYRESTADDSDLPHLLNFYKIYRAFVRGKVQSFLQADPDAPSETRDKARQTARRYFNLALGYLAAPCLIVVCGLMGSGKTTLAQEITRGVGACLLRSDIERKRLAGLSQSTAVHESFAQGIYTPEWNRRVYDVLQQKAEKLLSANHTIVVDASFSRREERSRFRQLAHAAQRPVLMFYLDCQAETLQQRLRQRDRDPDEPSDGRPELLADQMIHFEFPGDDEHIQTLDGTHDPCQNAQTVLCKILSRKEPSA